MRDFIHNLPERVEESAFFGPLEAPECVKDPVATSQRAARDHLEAMKAARLKPVVDKAVKELGLRRKYVEKRLGAEGAPVAAVASRLFAGGPKEPLPGELDEWRHTERAGTPAGTRTSMASSGLRSGPAPEGKPEWFDAKRDAEAALSRSVERVPFAMVGKGEAGRALLSGEHRRTTVTAASEPPAAEDKGSRLLRAYKDSERAQRAQELNRGGYEGFSDGFVSWD